MNWWMRMNQNVAILPELQLHQQYPFSFCLHTGTIPVPQFSSWHRKHPTPTLLPWLSSPLNMCSIPLRSGARNPCLSFLDIVFGFFNVHNLLLGVTNKVEPTLCLSNTTLFLSFHAINALVPFSMRRLGWGEKKVLLEPEKMCSCLPSQLPCVTLGRSSSQSKSLLLKIE